MAITLTVRDESLTGVISDERTLEMPAEHVTVRDLIRGRVYQEVQDHNLRQSAEFRGLVQPDGPEATLNGPPSTKFRPVDWKRQFDAALEAFEANRVLLLVDDRQVESLDEVVTLRAGSVATFLRLALLVGG